METALPLSSSFQNKDAKTKGRDSEYYKLDHVMMSWDDANSVPGLKTLDASFVKTPLSEEIPLMIACDGYRMDDGCEEFWNMIVKQNVAYVTSLNEEFSRTNRIWSAVFRYFPDETDGTLKVGKNMSIILVKTVKKQSMTIRTLQVKFLKQDRVIHTMKHIHFHAWEDFSTPANTAMEDLMSILQIQADLLMDQAVKLHAGKTKNPTKILIHCLAGRGRTGTALAIINGMISLQW